MTMPTRGHINCLLLGLLLPLARDDKFEDLVFTRARDLALADVFAALKDHDAVADSEDVLQTVRDDDLGDAVLLELEHGFEQSLSRDNRQIGRRFVEHDNARVE